MKISVAMATYNGEKYISEQIESILKQLSVNDELIISDDFSTDATYSILRKYSIKDSRIKVIQNRFNKGVVNNFQTAILECQNEVIFFSDQDDVWLDDKVKKIKKAFIDNPHKNVIISDAIIVNEDLNEVLFESFINYNKSKNGFFKNFIKNSYIGCTMAVRKDYLLNLLPFPNKIPMHDWWIGLLSELDKSSLFLPDKLILYRRHSQTVTSLSKGGNISKKIKDRKIILLSIYKTYIN